MTKNLIKSILDNLHPDLEDIKEISQKTFDLIDDFVEQSFNEDFCEILMNSIPKGTDLRRPARILDILIWSTPDNGTKLDLLIKDWLKTNDLNKIKTILFRKDWTPNKSLWPKERSHILNLIPDLKELIDYYSNELENSKLERKNKPDILKKLKESNNVLYSI